MRRCSRALSIGRRLALICVGVCLGCGARSSIGIPELGPSSDLDAAVAEALAPSSSVCVASPLEGGPLTVSLSYTARVSRADVLFLVDVTGSMSDVRSTLQTSLSEQLVPTLRKPLADL